MIAKFTYQSRANTAFGEENILETFKDIAFQSILK